MAGRNKSQKRQQDLKRRAKQRQATGVLPAHRNVLPAAVRLRPTPAAGEAFEDSAIFADESLERLTAEQRREAMAVRDSLAQIESGEFAEAQQRLKDIGRGSRFADWRLLVRGLVAFYQLDFAAAREAWQRLDPTRRPARIASALFGAEMGERLSSNMPPPSSAVTESVKELLHRPRTIAAAREITVVRHSEFDLTFCETQVHKLRNLRDDFRSSDPRFVDRFSEACVQLATFQPYADVFTTVTTYLPGPPHDPHWNLLTSRYFDNFENEQELVQRYLNRYLGQLDSLTMPDPKLTAAVRSLLLLEQAEVAIHRYRRGWHLDDSGDLRIEATRLLKAAIDAYPAHRDAHLQLIQLLETDIWSRERQRRPTKAVVIELRRVKQKFVEVMPQEVETALALIDEYFDIGDLTAAAKLIEQVRQQRLESPLARALPWKVKLLEAMDWSRRKKEVPAAELMLQEAESMWPTWLDRRWLPFLKAALRMRGGDHEGFAKLHEEACQGIEPSELLANVMTFAALQRMNVPAAASKSYREAVAAAANRASELPLSDLVSLGAFYWDLTRTGLKHPGYRNHVRPFGLTLIERFMDGESNCAKAQQEFPRFVDAFSWMAQHNFWRTRHEDNTEPWFREFVRQNPAAAAALLDQLLNTQFGQYRFRELRVELELLEATALTEKDPFQRHRFGQIARQVREAMRNHHVSFDDSGSSSSNDRAWRDDDEQDEREAPGFGDAWFSMDFGMDDDGLDDDSDDDSDDIEDDSYDDDAFFRTLEGLTLDLEPERLKRMMVDLSERLDEKAWRELESLVAQVHAVKDEDLFNDRMDQLREHYQLSPPEVLVAMAMSVPGTMPSYAGRRAAGEQDPAAESKPKRSRHGKKRS
jgi:hypothetical protein